VPGQLPQHDHTADPPATAVDGRHELSVANPTFLPERLGSECTDLQGLRELTVNGLDAIAALGERAAGRVVWDLDWQTASNTARGAMTKARWSVQAPLRWPLGA
jgi:hypothetical protein